MAIRWVGQARLTLLFNEHASDNTRFWYTVRITVPPNPRTARWEHPSWTGRFGSPAGGFGPGVAADSAKAYDQMAATAARMSSVWSPDDPGGPDLIVAGLFADAIAEALTDASIGVRRRKDGPVLLIE